MTDKSELMPSYQGALRTSSLKEGAVGAVRKANPWEGRWDSSQTCKQSPRKRRNGGMPVGHSGQIALSSEQCDMTLENWNSEIRDVHCYITARQTRFCSNEYASKNKITSVAVEWRCKEAFLTTGQPCFLQGPCWGFIKRTKNIIWVSWVSRCQPTRIWAWEQRNLNKVVFWSWLLQHGTERDSRWRWLRRND
jgi:hypothetical protein